MVQNHNISTIKIFSGIQILQTYVSVLLSIAWRTLCFCNSSEFKVKSSLLNNSFLVYSEIKEDSAFVKKKGWILRQDSAVIISCLRISW